MRYFVSAADPSAAADCRTLLDARGYHVLDDYDDDAIVLSLGGDGSILYNGRRYGDPTILPVAGIGSEANTVEVDEASLLERLSALEDGREGTDYHLETHRKLTASRDGEPIRDGFGALNDIHLHHTDPVRAAKFAARVSDVPADRSGDRIVDGTRETVYDADRIIGDGLLVATPFGSTGYYRSITDGTFETGVGVAFNNVHKPMDAPRSITLSSAGRVEVELLTTARSSSAVLARDDDPEVQRLQPGEVISISLSDRTVDIVRFGF